jgi:hypothetical protein
MKSKIIEINNGEKDYCIVLKRTAKTLEKLDKIFDLYDYFPIRKKDLFIKDGVRFICVEKHIYLITQRDKKGKEYIEKIFSVFGDSME